MSLRSHPFLDEMKARMASAARFDCASGNRHGLAVEEVIFAEGALESSARALRQR